MRLPKPCIDCGGLIDSRSRCSTCWSINEGKRGTTTQRGYGSAWQRLSARVIARDGGICRYCGAKATTADHVVAKANGGTDAMSNLVASCRPCNSGKRDR